MAAGAFFFSVMSALVKVAGAQFPTMQLVWVRSLVVLTITWGTLRLRGQSPLGRERGLLVLRGLFGFCGLSSFYYAVIHLPLAEATVIQYTNPVWTALIAALVLGEWVGWTQVLLALLALAGVVLVAQPAALFGGANAMDPRAVLIACAGALFSAAAYVTVRRLRGEATLVILFWFALIGSLFPIPIAFFGGWRVPAGWGEWALLAGVGVSTHLGQLYLTLGLQHEAAGRAMTVGYLQILFALGWGILLFGAVPDRVSVLGGLLIVGSIVGVARTRVPVVVGRPT